MEQTRPLRIVFAGTPDFAAHYLEVLLENTADQIVAVYTQPDRPAGRGKKLQASPVKKHAEQHQIPVYQPVSLKDPDAQKDLQALNPDLMIVVAYGLLLPQAVLDIPTQGCINVHASLLPRWRGAAPIQRAIEAGDKKSGITVMQMDAGLDTGDMLAISECDISAMDTGGSLHDKLLICGESALIDVLNQIRGDRLDPQPQDDRQSTYAPKISKQEAAIHWLETADLIERKIRAFYPFPIAHTEIEQQRVRIHQAFVVAEMSAPKELLPGQIIQSTSQGIDVATGQGVVRIKQLQMPGKKAMSVDDVLRGNATVFAAGNHFY